MDAKSTRYAITNTAAGPRGVHQDDGSYVELAPGETRAVDLTDAEHASATRAGYFEFGAKGKAATAAAASAAAASAAASATTTAPLPNNVMQLKKLARDEGIDVGEASKVDELQAAITAGRAAKVAQGGAGAPPVTPADDLDTLDDETLRATTAALTGKPVDQLPTDRESLLELARGVGE